MNRKKNTIVIASVIILSSVLLGFAYDMIMTAVEKSAHPLAYHDIVSDVSSKQGVPEYVIYGIMKTESDFNPNAVSEADAYGLMQITAGAYTDMTGISATSEAMLDPKNNIEAGTKYLIWLYTKFENWDTVLAAYNAGPGNVSKWLSDKNYSKDGKTLEHIPFTETRNYVRHVNDAMNTYKRLYK